VGSIYLCHTGVCRPLDRGLSPKNNSYMIHNPCIIRIYTIIVQMHRSILILIYIQN